MRSKKEIINDCKNTTYLGEKLHDWIGLDIDHILTIELLADLRDEQALLNKTLSAFLLECYGVEA